MRQWIRRLKHSPLWPRSAWRHCGLVAAAFGLAVLSRQVFRSPPCQPAPSRRGRRGKASPAATSTPEAMDPQKLLSARTQRLEQTMAALEGFCYTIAHDLRAPLRAMEGFAQALLDEYASQLDVTGAEYAQRISAAARRMDRMIQDLLDFEQLATVEPLPIAT